MARPSYDAKEAFELFKEQEDMARPLTASEIAEELDWSTQTVRKKLDQFVEDGKLATRKVGARTKIWWLPMRMPELIEQPEDIGIPESPEEVLILTRDMLSGDNDQLRIRAQAIWKLYETLQEKGQAKAPEMKEWIEGTNDGLTKRNRWVLYARDGLKSLPGVDYPPGSGVWRYIDPDSELAEELDVAFSDAVREITFEVGEEAADRRRALVQIAYDALKEEAPMRKRRFELVLPDYTAQYSEFDMAWSELIRPGLASLPGVQEPQPGSGVWDYLDPDSEAAQALEVEIDDWLTEIDVRGEGKTGEQRRALIQLAYNHLQEEGSATRSDFKEALPDFSAHYNDFKNLWLQCIVHALKQAPDVIPADGDNYTWRVAEDNAS